MTLQLQCARDFPCLQCRAASKECVRRRQGSLIDDVGTDGYVEALKARISVLKVRVDEVAVTPLAESEAAMSNRTPCSPAQHRTPRQMRDNMLDTMQEASYLSLSAMAERTDKHSSAAEGLSFRSLLGAVINTGQKTPTIRSGTQLRNFAVVDEFIRNGDTSIAHQAYLDHIREVHPYIEPTKLDNAHRHVLNTHLRGMPSSKATSLPETHVIIYLGLATGLLLLPGYDRHQQLIDDLIQCSLDSFGHVLEVSDDLSAIHCLIALTICSLFNEKAGSTWHLLGLAMTRCVACGMHTMKEPQEEPTEQTRAFRTLFLLDTRVSSALDRPFYLEDPAFATPSGVLPGENLHRLVLQSSMMRATRKVPQGEALCTFVNLQHLHEFSAARYSSQKPKNIETYAAGLVELSKYCTITEDFSRKMMIEEMEEVFTRYLASFEDNLISQAGAPTSMDVMLVLATGAIMCRLHALGYIAQQHTAYQAINILTLLSTRYSYARGLRDVLMESLLNTTGTGSQQPSARLCELIAKVELQLPTRTEMILLGRKPL